LEEGGTFNCGFAEVVGFCFVVVVGRLIVAVGGAETFLFVTAGDGSFPQISTVEIYEYVEYI
jgi:hypothetical protein